jgi:hypothetical protein
VLLDRGEIRVHKVRSTQPAAGTCSWPSSAPS